MSEPPQSPFTLNRSRIFLLAMGALILLIVISTSMGGLQGYQALREAASAATTPSAEQTSTQ